MSKAPPNPAAEAPTTVSGGRLHSGPIVQAMKSGSPSYNRALARYQGLGLTEAEAITLLKG